MTPDQLARNIITAQHMIGAAAELLATVLDELQNQSAQKQAARSDLGYVPETMGQDQDLESLVLERLQRDGQ